MNREKEEEALEAAANLTAGLEAEVEATRAIEPEGNLEKKPGRKPKSYGLRQKESER